MWSFPAAVWPPPLADLARLPADLAWGRAWQQARLQRSLFDLCFSAPGRIAADRLGARAARRCRQSGGPAFRPGAAQHAAGVLAGAWPRSLLESMRFEQQLGAMERLALGPLARRV